jgi:hypothetical protein
MHQTTIRFGEELWEQLLAAAEDARVSVAEWVRTAAIGELVRRERPADRRPAAPAEPAELWPQVAAAADRAGIGVADWVRRERARHAVRLVRERQAAVDGHRTE